MSLTQTEEIRIRAIENKLNEIQTALNQLATRAQLKALLAIRQSEIDQLQIDVDHVNETGVTPGLSAHKVDPNAHLELNDRYYTELEVDSFINEVDTEIDTLTAGLDTLDSNFQTHASRHAVSGLDPLGTAAPYRGIGAANDLGASVDFARSDHDHLIREASGMDLSMGPLASGQLLRRAANTLAGIDVWQITNPDQQVLYVDVDGNDANSGSWGAPILTIRELTRRLNRGPGELRQVYFGLGTFKLTDYIGLGLTNARTTWGSTGAILTIDGYKIPSTSFTVSSRNQTAATITATGSPNWTIDEHQGKFIIIVISGSDRHVPILSNTSDTITVAVGSAPALPTSGIVQMYTHGTIIAPPDTNPSSSANSLYHLGKLQINTIKFTSSTAIVGSSEGSELILQGNYFLNNTIAMIPRGNCTISGNIFDTCTTGISAGLGFFNINRNFFKSCSIGISGQFQGCILNLTSTGLNAFKNVTQALLITTGATISDFQTRVYMDNVQDYITVQKGGKYQKAISNPAAIAGFGSPTRNVVRCIAGSSEVDLLNTAASNFTPAGSYINIAGTDYTQSQYSSMNYTISGQWGNLVFDGGDA